MSQKLLNKDKTLRKQYKRFEIWTKLNKSVKKCKILYNIPGSLDIKKKKYTVKHLSVIIVLKLVEAKV